MRAFLVLLCACAACSAGSSPSGGAPEGGADGAGAGPDATSDACFPFCSSSSGGSSSGGSDAGGTDAAADGASCDALKAKVESLLPAARACNPALQGQCGGEVEGICCPVSVTAGNESAANDLAVAVADYKASCTPSCMGIICSSAPSNTCEPLQGSQGQCR